MEKKETKGTNENHYFAKLFLLGQAAFHNFLWKQSISWTKEKEVYKPLYNVMYILNAYIYSCLLYCSSQSSVLSVTVNSKLFSYSQC